MSLSSLSPFCSHHSSRYTNTITTMMKTEKGGCLRGAAWQEVSPSFSAAVPSPSQISFHLISSVDASVPLLVEPDFNTNTFSLDPEYARFNAPSTTLTAQPPSPPLTPSPSSSSYHYSPRRLFTPSFRSFSARPPLADSSSDSELPIRSDSEPASRPSRFGRSAPQ